MKKYSQNNEQEIVLNFLEKNNLTSGKLLDVGSFDGELFSNVRAVMEKYSEWSGVFVEPSSYCFTKLFDLYKSDPKRATLLNLAVVTENDMEESNILKFYDSPLSTVSSSIEGHTQKYGYNDPREVYVGKISLNNVIEKFGPFDIISVDVEGYSAKLALQESFDPSKFNCKMLLIEHDGYFKELQRKFIPLGYSLVSLNGENVIFIKTF